MAGIGSQAEFRVIEERVSLWLEENHCLFTTGNSLGLANIDFLVYEPFPVAIEIIGSLSVTAARMKKKRLLADRMIMAQELGWTAERTRAEIAEVVGLFDMLGSPPRREVRN